MEPWRHSLGGIAYRRKKIMWRVESARGRSAADGGQERPTQELAESHDTES